MTSNYSISNYKSFSSLFMPYKSGTKKIVNYQESGTDIGNLYQPYYRGTIASNTGFKSTQNNILVDLSTLFQNIDITLLNGYELNYNKVYSTLRSSIFTFTIQLDYVIKYQVLLNFKDTNNNIISSSNFITTTSSSQTTSTFNTTIAAKTFLQNFQPQITLYNDVGDLLTFLCSNIITQNVCKHIRITACGGGGGGGSGGRNTYSHEVNGGNGGGGGAACYTSYDIFLPIDYPLYSIYFSEGTGGIPGTYADEGDSGNATDNGRSGGDGNTGYVYGGDTLFFSVPGGKGGRGGDQNHGSSDEGLGTGGEKSSVGSNVNTTYEYVLSLSSNYISYNGYNGKFNQNLNKYDGTIYYSGYPFGSGGATYLINSDLSISSNVEINGSGGNGGTGTGDLGKFPGPGILGKDGFMKIDYIANYYC